VLLPTDPRVHIVFDVIAWASSALLMRALFRWRLADAAADVARTAGRGYVFALAAGAIAGAWLLGSFNTALSAAPHLSHSVAGALGGGIVGVELHKRACGIRGSTGAIWVGPIALGVAVGRLGCLFSGLADETYGIPTARPWAVDLGDGVMRHPVQLYESLAMLVFLVVYLIALGRRSHWARTDAFYVFVFVYGAQRFVWEFVKPYPRLVGPLDVFQLAALAMMTYAVVYGHAHRRFIDTRT
jgi:phosphatidylglycerol---prolipoprotein diacylglyceryl transferase